MQDLEQSAKESVNRINFWLSKRKRDSMIHPEQIHGYWMDDELAELLVSDLRNVLECASRYIDLCS